MGPFEGTGCRQRRRTRHRDPVGRAGDRSLSVAGAARRPPNPYRDRVRGRGACCCDGSAAMAARAAIDRGEHVCQCTGVRSRRQDFLPPARPVADGPTAGPRYMVDWTHARARSHRCRPDPSRSSPTSTRSSRPGEPAQAHIVKVEPGESAAAKVLEARIYGTPDRGAVRPRVGAVARPQAAAAVRAVQVDLRDVQVVQRRPAGQAQRVTSTGRPTSTGCGSGRPCAPSCSTRTTGCCSCASSSRRDGVGDARRRPGAGRGRRGDVASRARRGARAARRRDRRRTCGPACT